MSYPLRIIECMDSSQINDAIGFLQKANALLLPELLSTERARELMTAYSRAERLVAFGIAALSRKLNEEEVARATGSSVARAKTVIETGRVMVSCEELSSAMQHGDVRWIRPPLSLRPSDRRPERHESSSPLLRNSRSTC